MRSSLIFLIAEHATLKYNTAMCFYYYLFLNVIIY